MDSNLHPPRLRLTTSWLWLGLLVVSFPLILYLWFQQLALPFFALSADDFSRTLLAWRVTQGQLIPSDVWLPLQFWVEALAYQFYPHWRVVPMLINLLAATGTLVCLLGIGYEIGLRTWALLWQLLLMATLPWFVWLSLSGLSEPLFCFWIALAAHGLLRWLNYGQRWVIWGAALSLLAANATRFDAWGVSVLFSLYLAWRWVRVASPRPHYLLLVAALPWLFPMAWMGYHGLKYGDPFFSTRAVRAYILARQGTKPLLNRLLLQFQDLWQVGTIIIPLGLIGAWGMRKRRTIQLLALLWLGVWLMLMGSALQSATASHNTPRLVVLPTLLLVPCAVWALTQIGALRLGGRWLILLLITALVVVQLNTIPHYPNNFAPEIWAVGRHLIDLRATGQLCPGDPILIEVKFWDYLALQVLTDDPAAVVFDRNSKLLFTPAGTPILDDANNPSLFARPTADLQVELARRQIRFVLAYTDVASTTLQTVAQQSWQAGDYSLFLLAQEADPPPCGK